MELIELRKELEEINKRITEFKTSLKIEDKTERVAEIENMMLEADFWNDSEAASLLVTESKSIKKELDEFSEMIDYLEHSEEMVEFLKDEDDEEIYQDLLETVVNLKSSVEDFSFRLLFSEEYDNNTAILEIHAGAGGTDATDWSELMLRMYERFFTKQGLKYSYLNYQSGDITGVKSATIKIEGDFAYGLLKGEKGVHRVVRISPFDPSGKRHTSFASIDVIPEFNEDEINIEINNEDLKIDTYRAQGAGGQHINTTDSAVRITHLPTGIVVQSQSERSQIQNKDAAMKNLKSKLYQLEIEEKEKELAAIRGEQKDISWGSQIRSYVFTPYTMVKDHRTNYEVSTVDKVMDGEIIDFIDAYLHYNIKEKEVL
ncbi:peptide chain release factor 2 [uncultured Gemella sp.]|uniref:peptide chain release factor 2 n=1 Tax=uncultured Gemella sp. TaxID=254352 RepID=UPI002628F3D2|nr:peptide chain release factor 2 [uncultured Gemella sp.]